MRPSRLPRKPPGVFAWDGRAFFFGILRIAVLRADRVPISCMSDNLKYVNSHHSEHLNHPAHLRVILARDQTLRR